MQHWNMDKRWTDITLIKEGDWILLKRKESEKRKLALIVDESFQVTKISTNTVTLQFPPKSHAHPMINISQVQLYFGLRPQLITAPSDDDAGHEYKVDQIMGYRKWNGKEYYYIHWKGYPMDDNTWEPKENISEATLRIWEHQSREKWRMAEPQFWMPKRMMESTIDLKQGPPGGRRAESRNWEAEGGLGFSRTNGLFNTQRNLRKCLLNMQRNLHECLFCSLLFFGCMRILERESVM